MSITNFPAVPKDLILIPYTTTVGDVPVELYGTFCRWSKEFEAEAVAINVGGQVIDITSIVPQQHLDELNKTMRRLGIGEQYAAERAEDIRAMQRAEHCFAGVGA
jgi:hypothetical protein